MFPITLILGVLINISAAVFLLFIERTETGREIGIGGNDTIRRTMNHVNRVLPFLIAIEYIGINKGWLR